MTITAAAETNLSPAIACSAFNVTRIFGKGSDAIRALDQVSLNIDAGRFTVLLDPTSGGAAALLGCLSGADTPTSGHVFTAGTDIVFSHDTADGDELQRLRQLADNGRTIVMATGSLASAAYADRVVVLHHGRVSADIDHQRRARAAA